jgi:drug/metabolite transporter (DMT)-like permease
MTFQAVILLLVAAAFHAAWNFSSKFQNITPAAFLVANTLGVSGLLLPIFLYAPARQVFQAGIHPSSVWGWVVLTGLFQALYYWGLSGAYKTGDLSLAYPLLRAVPVVLVLLANIPLGRVEQISPLAGFGMIMVAAGAVILPLKKFNEWTIRRWFIPAVAWAMFTALNTVGYSLVDDHALRILRASSVTPVGVTLVYAFWEGIAASVWLVLILLITSNGRASLARALRNRLSQAAFTGFGIYLAYTLVLIAMGYVRNVSYVVAFRQTSILFGSLLGILVLKEPRYAPRLTGAIVIFIGLVFVGMG